MDTEYKILIKLVVLGDAQVGKSSLIYRHTRNEFEHVYCPTIGLERMLAFMKVDNRQEVTAQICDFVTLKKYTASTSAYSSLCSGAGGALLVYDITRRGTYLNAQNWLKDLRDYAPPGLVVMLIGNKSDLTHSRAVSSEEAKQFAVENCLLHIETSALDTSNVELAFSVTLLREQSPEHPFVSRSSSLIKLEVLQTIDAEGKTRDFK